MRELLDSNELAAYLSVKPRMVRNLVEKRQIPYIKVGHLLRFDRDLIDEWVEARRIPERTSDE